MEKLIFDINEAKVLVNDEGIPTEVLMRERGEGERLIESFMLAANETVAEHFNKLKYHLFIVFMNNQNPTD